MFIQTKTIKIPTLVFMSLAVGLLQTGCMTSQRQQDLQSNIKQVDSTLSQKIKTQDNQLDALASAQISAQSQLHDAVEKVGTIQENVDTLNEKINIIQEQLKGKSLTASNDDSLKMQNQLTQILSDLAFLKQKSKDLEQKYTLVSLLLPDPLATSTVRTGSLPKNILNDADEQRTMIALFEKGKFTLVAQLASQVLNAQESTNTMLGHALTFRGEANFQLARYAEAVLDFRVYLAHFPHGVRVARTLLLTGDSFVHLEFSQEAATYYQMCLSQFPNTPEGDSAADRLKSMGLQTVTTAVPTKK